MQHTDNKRNNGDSSVCMTDDEREVAIDRAYFMLIGAKSPKERRQAWSEMQALVLGRSKAQREKMADERGLPAEDSE